MNGTHSIEELKRQVEAARGKAEAANIALRDARERLQLARLEQSGLFNQVVNATGTRMVVVDVEFHGDDTPWRLITHPIKKDGTIGTQRRSVYLHGASSVVVEGEYVAPEAGK